MKSTHVILVALLTLISCELFEPDENLGNKNEASVRIEYLGLTSWNRTDAAAFKLVNDSTASIQYFAYDRTSLHYSTEALSDTGWAYQFWNWCGTGAEYFELEAGGEVEFTTMLPPSSSTWRVLVSVSDMDHTYSYILRSESVEYTHP